MSRRKKVKKKNNQSHSSHKPQLREQQQPEMQSADYGPMSGDLILDDRRPKGLVGCRNLGNTCYMNSALQCLSNCFPMTTYFLDLVDNDITDVQKCRVVLAYRKLIDEVWSEERPVLAIPVDLLRAIQFVNPSFRGYQQQDTQELLRCLIDQLHEELKQVVNFDPPYHHVPDPSDPERRIVKYGSFISDLFNGLINSRVRCHHCGKISDTTETFQDLSLPIPSGDQLKRLHDKADMAAAPAPAEASTQQQSAGSWVWSPFHSIWSSFVNFWSYLSPETVTLDDCLSAFFSVDALTGDNMYSCGDCRILREGTKEVSIDSLPEVMCIHLKRFRHDLLHSSKISSHVSFPVEGLDVKSYMRKGELSEDTQSLYNLTGVICHQGSVAGGHYVAYAQHPATRCWYLYDDSYVSMVDVDVVQQCQAYVLFYSRHCSDEQYNFRTQYLSRISRLGKPGSPLSFYVSKKWLLKLFTCGHPGPINTDYMCAHGAVRPSEYKFIHDKVMALSSESWHHIQARFGGGPVVNHLVECKTCKTSIEELRARQTRERHDFALRNKRSHNNLYAVSLRWYRKWEHFVEGHTYAPPGPIDNRSIVTGKSTKTDALGKRHDTYRLKKNVSSTRRWDYNRVSSYAEVTGSQWRYLKNIYGGGPEAIAVEGRQQVSDSSNDEEEEEEEEEEEGSNSSHQPSFAQSGEKIQQADDSNTGTTAAVSVSHITVIPVSPTVCHEVDDQSETKD